MLINQRGNKYSVATKDLKKYIEHLTFIRNNIPLTRTSNNILRVIVGNDPIRSKNPSEDLFLEAKLQPVSKLLVTSVKKTRIELRVKEQTPEDYDVIFDFILTKILMMIIWISASLKRMKLFKILSKIIVFIIKQKMTKTIFNFIC